MAAAPAGRATGIEGKVAPGADATRELYERYSGQIFGYCLHRLGSREEAEDAVQSTFLNAFRGLARGVVPQSDSAWLFKIAENVCHSRHRSSWRRGRVESPSDLDAFQDVLPAPPRAQDELIPLGEALERLPENQRRAILLREWQGLSYREISEELDLSQSAVETLIFRARRSLVDGLEAPLPRRARVLRRARHGVDVGGVVGALKVAFAGGAAVKVAAVAVAVTGASVAGHRHHPVRAAAPAKRTPAQPDVAQKPPARAAAQTSATPAVKPKPRPRPARAVKRPPRHATAAPPAVQESPPPAPPPPEPAAPMTTAGPPPAPPPGPPPPPPTLVAEIPAVVPEAQPTPKPSPTTTTTDTQTQPTTTTTQSPSSTQTVTGPGG
ncbi:MAG TPA: sigma-70 family RNA polymerase sigma factor [Gaiellaceae bacterium]